MAAPWGKDGPQVDNLRGAKMDKKWIAIVRDKVVLIDHSACWWKSGSEEGKTRWHRSTTLLGDEKMDEKWMEKNRWKKDKKRIKKVGEKNGWKRGLEEGKTRWLGSITPLGDHRKKHYIPIEPPWTTLDPPPWMARSCGGGWQNTHNTY